MRRPEPERGKVELFGVSRGRNAPAAHHTVMSTAVGIDVFREFARIARIEFLGIDEATTVRSFEDEVRWNAAYYRLAAGL